MVHFLHSQLSSYIISFSININKNELFTDITGFVLKKAQLFIIIGKSQKCKQKNVEFMGKRASQHLLDESLKYAKNRNEH